MKINDRLLFQINFMILGICLCAIIVALLFVIKEYGDPALVSSGRTKAVEEKVEVPETVNYPETFGSGYIIFTVQDEEGGSYQQFMPFSVRE